MITHTRIKYSIFPIISLILLILSSAVPLSDANRIIKENSKAVVVITAYDEKGNAISQGSGFIVRRDGAVVTNYHVINMAKDIKIKAGDKIFDVEGLIFTDKENDLVILKAKARDMPVVKLGVIGKADIGENIYVIGNPSGLENTISVGLLSRIRKIDEKREILKMTVPASPGSSGSPVFKRNGEVIGVVTSSSISGTRNSCFAISVKLIKDKISSKNVTAIKESGLEDFAMYWFYLGGVYGKSDRYEEAIEAYKQAISIDPDYANAHNGLGAAYGKSDRYEEAIEAYKQAIRIDPDYANAYYNLGVAYGNLGKYKEAIASSRQAIRIDPDYANAYYNLGVAYAESGMYKEGSEACKQAIRIDPAFAEAHYNLGLSYAKSGMYKEAIDAYKQAVRINPDLAEAHFGLSVVYYKSGMYIEEIEALKQAIRIDPDDAVVHNNLGATYYNLGKYKEAMEAFKQAVRINPDDAEAHSGLGAAYGKSDRYEEAIETFKQAIRINPDDAVVHNNLGAAYVFLKDRDSALEQYKILKSLDSELANVMFKLINK